MANEKLTGKKITLGFVLSWIFGVIFALSGLGLIFSDFAGGIIMCLMAAILLPPVNELVDSKFKFHLSGGIKIVLILLGLASFGLLRDTSDLQKVQNVDSVEKQVQEIKQGKDEEKVSETASQKNAIRKAKSYLDMSGFSRDGLIKQLEFEKFSKADATYAVDGLSIDWNIQAERKAKSYNEMSGYSRDGLIGQLKFEGFTLEQAEFGVRAIGL